MGTINTSFTTIKSRPRNKKVNVANIALSCANNYVDIVVVDVKL